jgi:hypothetical protein
LHLARPVVTGTERQLTHHQTYDVAEHVETGAQKVGEVAASVVGEIKGKLK